MCSFFIQSDRRLVQAFLRDYVSAVGASDQIKEEGGGGGSSGGAGEHAGGGEGGGGGVVAVESTTIDVQREPPQTGPCSRQSVAEATKMFDMLEQAAEM